jgi:hypothetical protein
MMFVEQVADQQLETERRLDSLAVDKAQQVEPPAPVQPAAQAQPPAEVEARRISRRDSMGLPDMREEIRGQG